MRKDLKLTETHKQMLEGKVCSYCGKPTELVKGTVIYGDGFAYSNKNFYYCKPCDAYVGCHEGSTISYGRVADKKLRVYKRAAHKVFDMIHLKSILSKDDAYFWLAEVANVSPKYAHIGMLNVESCKLVIESSVQLLNDFRRLDMDFNVEPTTPYLELKDYMPVYVDKKS